MLRTLRFILNSLFVILVCGLCSCAAPRKNAPPTAMPMAEAVNIMGDWQGNLTLSDGSNLPIVAQVIPLGSGLFRANILTQFDKRIEPMTVLEGNTRRKTVYFSEPNAPAGGDKWQAVIKAGKFSGTFSGEKNGSFTMQKIIRLSPALGDKPPEGAAILFGGNNLDQWQPGEPLGFVGIYSVLGKSKAAAAYIRSDIYSEKEQAAALEIGSDDGVKVWLNGEIVHSNNVIRMCTPAQDKIKVTLKQGWNTLMLKVTTKGGPWAACARLTDKEGKPLYNIWEKDIYSMTAGETRKFLDINSDYLTAWQITGPYKQQGKDARTLFDTAFAPEAGNENVKWLAIGREYFEKKTVKWKLVDDAMEVGPGTGSIVSKRKFNDFKLHLEFRTPFMPQASGQKRGNSGVYLQGRYEVQILDSYGLKGENNECGAIYEQAPPSINMCAPPLQWQSYDVTFCAPRFDEASKKIKPAILTVFHNGVQIYDDIEVSGPTAYPLDYNQGQMGGILLQDHADLVQYRNIWVVELPEAACN